MGNQQANLSFQAGERTLVSCQACKWSKRHDTATAAAHDGVRHLETEHPPLADRDRDAADDSDLLRLLEEALTLRCCHLSGTHNPTHYEEGRFVCQSQQAEAWHRAVRLLGLGHLDSADSAVADPGTCYWCHRAEQQRGAGDVAGVAARQSRA